MGERERDIKRDEMSKRRKNKKEERNGEGRV
jgi:hypothetical protein